MTRLILFILAAAVLLTQAAVAQSPTPPPPAADAEAPGFWHRLGDLFRPQRIDPRVELLRRQSTYFDIVVEQDSDDLRHLVFLPNHGSQTIIDPADPTRPVSTYLQYMFLALPALPRPPERVLFIGLGGGIMPMILRKYFPESRMDIVEIDPAVVEIAEAYFFFRRDERMAIHLGDGRAFLNRDETRYDIIVLDAYNADAIPFHLTTKEFYETMGRRLAPGGVIVVNSAELARKDFNACEIRTVAAALPHLAVHRNESATNYVFLASVDNPLDMKAMYTSAMDLDARVDAGFRLAPLVDRRLTATELTPLTKDAMILTDDFAPVDHMDAAP
jgi:spermidine synthase